MLELLPQLKIKSLLTVRPRRVPGGEGPGYLWENLPGYFPSQQWPRGGGHDQQVPLRRGGDTAGLHQSDQ